MKMGPDCIPDALAYEFVHGRLTEPALGDVEAHLNACTECREVIAATAKCISEERATQQTTLERYDMDGEPVPVGANVGRYAVDHVLGAGGMGVVYAAYDPNLERRVAIKLLRPELSSASASIQDRLVREARVMARLSHPNVVAVHDAGMYDGRVFIAMELVEGVTLREWQQARVRSWREVLAVFIAAGRGLAHAHGSGLVHRDFKPENVLISKDGRVRVTDFGLARPSSEHTEPAVMVSSGTAAVVTQTGAIAGTPAYMAPEQLRGTPPDPRTDQFSFCVTLYEALYGTRPFPARTVELLTEQLKRGLVGAPPTGDVPAWLYAILERGLRVSPDERYPAMEALLAALASPPVVKRKRRRWLIPASFGVIAAAIGTIAIAGQLGTAPAAVEVERPAAMQVAPAEPMPPPPQPSPPPPSPSPPPAPTPPVQQVRHAPVKHAPPPRRKRHAATKQQPTRHESTDEDALLP